MMCGRTVMDAAIIDALQSTKNAEQARDPEMHQINKGNVWYFERKYDVGVDADSGLVHTVITTSTNVHDVTPVPKLLRENDEAAYGDSAYCAVENHHEVKNNPNLSKIDFKVNKQKPCRKNCWLEGLGTYWLCQLEYKTSRVRSKVEYVLTKIKDIFDFSKTPYRGIRKLEATGNILFALANLYMICSGQRCAT